MIRRAASYVWARLHITVQEDWEGSFDRPVFAVATVGRYMVGFSANKTWGNPVVEVYLGVRAVEFYWDRYLRYAELDDDESDERSTQLPA